MGLYPTATCIEYNSSHAQLLIIGLNGMCLFDVSSRKLKEISDTDLVCSSCYIVLVFVTVYGKRGHFTQTKKIEFFMLIKSYNLSQLSAKILEG